MSATTPDLEPDRGREPSVDVRLARTGVVLCGGRSRRMGRDKAAIALDGRALIEHALAALDGVAATVVLACGSEPRYAELGRALVLDPEPDRGPLAGLLAALEAARSEYVVALACDMPHVETAVLEHLARAAAERELDVAMLATDAGVEPLCAVYRRTCAAAARAAFERGENKLTAFHTIAVDGRALRVATLSSAAFPAELRERAERAPANLNTPQDLERELAGRRGAAHGR